MNSKLFKKLFSLLLVVSMVLSMCPTFVFAEGASGDGCVPCPHCNNAHVADWTPWDGTGTLSAGHYYVQPGEGKDMIALSATVSISADVVIDLNGYTIQTPEGLRAFSLKSTSSKLSIMDSSEDQSGVIRGAESGFKGSGGIILIDHNSAVFKLYSGTIKDGKVVKYTNSSGESVNVNGGNICVNKGVAYLIGGKVEGGYSGYRGGSIYVATSTAHLYIVGNAEVVGGEAANWGGNIYVNGNGSLYIGENAKIYDGIATSGTDVRIGNGRAYIYGGIIGPGTSSGNSFVTGSTASSHVAKVHIYGGTIHGYSFTNPSGKTGYTQISGGRFTSNPSSYLVSCENSSCEQITVDGVKYYEVTHATATTTDASCTENGSRVFACSACDLVSNTEKIVAPGHNWEVKSTKVTCGASGVTSYECTACDQTHTCNEAATGDHDLILAADKTKYTCKDCSFETPAKNCAECGPVPQSEWKAWSGGELQAGKHYYLADDVALPVAVSIASGKICIDMNGHNITTCAVSGVVRGITVTGATLNIMNSSKEAASISAGTGGVFGLWSKAVLNLSNVTVSGGATGSEHGGNMYVKASTLSLDNCIITDGTGNKGGNICLYESKLTIMGDTQITNGNGTGNGDNLYIGTTSNVVMYSGSITGSAEDVCHLSGDTTVNGNFYMYGGTIGNMMHYNYSVYYSKFYMYGGTVDKILIGSSSSAKAKGEIIVYNGKVGTNPLTCYYGSTSILAPCTDYCVDADGKWVIWHDAKKCTDATHATELAKAETKYADIHKWNDATCTDPKTCPNCEQTQGEVAPSAHTNLQLQAGQAVTCLENGWNDYYYCSGCEKYFSDAEGKNLIGDAAALETWKTGDGKIAAPGSHDWNAETGACKRENCEASCSHSYNEGVVTKAPTCTEAGVKTFTCGVCGHTYTETIDALTHNWNEGVVTQAPTCNDAGVKTYTCKNDASHTKTVAVSALGHDAVTDAAVAATCEDTGLTEGSHCDRCNTALVPQEVVPALGHDWNEGVVTKTPTCNDAGVKTYTCKNDASHTKTEAVSALGHNAVTDAAVAPGCESTGLTEGSHCDRCNTVLVAQEVVPALGHDWNEGVISPEPTCDNAGVKTYTCKNDVTHTKTEAVSALGHNAVIDAAVAPGCESTGLTEGSHCDRCNTVIKAQEVVPALGHAYGEGVYTVPTTEADGYTTYVCGNNCGIDKVVVDEGTRLQVNIPAVDADQVTGETGNLTTEQKQEIIDDIIHENTAAVEKDVFDNSAANDAVIEQMKAEDATLADKKPVLNVVLKEMDVKENVANKVTYDVTPMLGDKKISLVEAITFYLPVPDSLTGFVNVYHEGEMLLEKVAILVIDGHNYVEVSSKDFSLFTVELYEEKINYVAEVGGVGYETIADALEAAQNGDTIVLLADVTLDRAVTLTNKALTITGDYSLNANNLLTLAGTVSLNAPKLTGDVKAAGNAVIKDTNIGAYLSLNASDSALTFQGDNKLDGFSASYYNNVITIGAGASLEITGSSRLTIGWGNTFNITGTIADAKTADKSAIKPSLKVAAGITVNGSSALTTFNVTNAYIVLNSTCGTNKNATGKFVLSFNNSIADLSMFKQQYAYGTYDVDFVDSVINANGNLVFLSPNAVVDVDNSNITVNSSFGNAGKFTLSNGSVMTVKSMLESTENGYNAGLTIVDNATLNVTGGVYSGYNTGKLQVVNGGVANINKIVKSTIELDADSTVNVTTIDATSSVILGAGASIVVPESVTVTTVEGWEVKYENGAYVSVQSKVYVAEVGGVQYESLQDAIDAAGYGDTVTLLADINVGTGCALIRGKEITIDLNGHNITGTGYRVLFVDLLASQNKDGKLTLVGNGTVENTGTTSASSYAVYVGGNSELVVEAGATVKSANGYAVFMAPMGAGRVSKLTVNGGTVTGRYAVSGSGQLTDTSTVITVNSGAVIGTEVGIYQPQPGTVTVNGGTVSGGQAALAMRRGTASITGGTIVGLIDVVGDYDATNVAITGGDFTNATLQYADGNGNVVTKADAVELAAPADYKWVNGVLTVCEYVAEVNGERFETLQEAIDAAGYGDTVTILVDMELTSDLNNAAKGLFNIAADDKIVLDLNGKTISVTDNSNGNFIVLYSYGDLTVKNGTIELTSTKDRAYASQSTVILNRGGKLTIESGKYIHHGGDSMAITVDNSANSFGDAYLYVNGGEIISETYIAIRMRLEDPNANGNPGNGLSFVEVTGGYIFGANRGIWGQKCSGANELQGTLTVTGGTIENTRADRGAIQIDTDSYAAQNMLVSISGNADIKGALKGGNDEFAVSGGTFTVAVPEEYCAEGYQPKDNGNGTFGVVAHTCSYNEQYFEATFDADAYTVYTCACGDTYTVTHEGTKKIAVATVNGEKFESFEDAITYANEQTGTVTVTLLADVEFSGDDLYADMILDLNGKTITATGSYVFWFEGGSLVIKDSSAEKTGMIDGSATVGNAFLLMGNESLTVESGKIYANNNVFYVNGDGATVTVNGGELKSVIATGNIFYLVGNNDTITVNGGTFLGNVNPYGGSLTIYGGSFTADVNAYCAADHGAVKNSEGMYEIIEVNASNAAAKIGDKYYLTLGAAINAAGANDTIVVLKDVTESLPTLKGKIVPANETVTITATNTDWIYLPYAFEIGEGVTLNIPYGGMFVYNTEGAVIKGDVVTDALYLAYAGTKLTVYEPGSLTVTSETCIIRYMEGDVDSGLYIVGDNNDATVGLKAEVIYFYQGTISAKDANINVKVYWQTQETDGQGSASLVLDNTKMDVTVDGENFKATGNSSVTLKNGSILTIAKAYEGVRADIQDTSKIIVNGKLYYVALVNGKGYETLEAAVEAAQENDTVTILTDLSDLAITVDKSLTITSAKNVLLTNVSINGTAGKLTVSNLTFAGNSWINAGGCDELVVKNVTANVTPSNTAYTNSRSAFIGLGRNEGKQLKLTVTDCNIVVPSGSNAVLGWAAVTEVTISGNTFGSETSYQNNGDIVKFMAIADGAVFYITDNTSYSNYNGYVFAQNTTRGNAYSVILEGNTFFGGADHIWVEISGGNTVNAKIEATSDNTVNGKAFTAADIKYHYGVIKNWNGYAGVDITKDAEGKLTGGSFLLAPDAELLAEGYVAKQNSDGTYTVIAHTCSFTATITTAPTTTTEGVKTFTCTCGDSYTETMPVLPRADVTDKGATTYVGSYYVFDVANRNLTSENGGINLPKTLVFAAKDKGDAATNNYYANFNTDFYVKLDGLSADTVQGTGCYLAGYYAAFKAWVVIPLDNVDIQNGLAYPLLAIAGFDFSYEMICNDVEEFTCGLYLSDEFLAANPNVQVTVDLGLREEPADLGDLANVEYFESEGFEYNKEDLDAKLVAEVNGVKYYTLAEAIAAAQAGDTVTLLADVTINELIKIEKAITLNLNDKTITANCRKAIEVYADATITNGTIIANERCVDTRKAVELTLTDVNLKATQYKTGNQQPLTIGGSENGTVVNLNNVTIDAGTQGYAIITFVETEMNAVNSNISGYMALYVKAGSEGSEFNFENSTLTSNITGNDVAGNATNIITVEASDIAVNVTGGALVANGVNQTAIALRNVTGTELVINAEITAPAILKNVDAENNTIIVPAQYADELAADGYAYITNGDGTVTAHTHVYEQTGYTDPTFDADGFWTYTCYCGDSYTVTDEGTKKTAVATVDGERFETFEAAWAAAQAGQTIELLADIKLTGKLELNKSVTIDGNGHSLIADETAVWYTVSGKFNTKNYKTHLLGVNADGIVLKDVVLDCNNNAAGINVYKAQNVVFDNVSIINATKGMAALTVNGSTVTFRNAFTALGNGVAMDISNGSGVTTALGVTFEDGTVTNLDNKTVKFASVANNDVSGAVKADGTAYFAAMDNAYYYTEAQINSRTTGYSNGLTLLSDVNLPEKVVQIKGTLNLNGYDLVIKELQITGKTTLIGGEVTAEKLTLTSTSATLTAPADLDVTTSVAGYVVIYEDGTYKVHSHAYTAEVTAPTCTAEGYTTYTCTCGDTYKDNYVDATGHSYTSEYHAATNTEDAYTVYTCVCGDTYTVVEEGTALHVAINVNTGVTYADLQEALDKAKKNETVKLLKDVTAEDIYAGAGKTLDLNGKKLTVTSSISASYATTHIIDSTDSKGLLVTEGADVALNSKNAQLPVWTAEGARFVAIAYRRIIETVEDDPDALKFRFYFDVADDAILPTLLTEGCITIRIKVNYTSASGMNAYQNFELTDALVDVYVAKWPDGTVDLTLRDAVGLKNLNFTAEIVSTAPNGSSVVIGSAPIGA